MVLIKSNKNFNLFWSAREQAYFVYRFDELLLKTSSLTKAENYIS